MNTQGMAMPAQGEVRTKESPSARGVGRPAAKDQVAQADEDKGEDAPFGAALQSVIATDRPKASRTAGSKGGAKSRAWDVAATLVKRTKAVGRIGRGVSELAITRPQASASQPSLIELNAAGNEFSGKGASLADAEAGAEVETPTKAAPELKAKEGAVGDRPAARAMSLAGAPPDTPEAKAQGSAAGQTDPGDAHASVDDEVADDDAPRAVTPSRSPEESSPKGQRAEVRLGPNVVAADEAPAAVAPSRGGAEVASAQDAATRVRTTTAVLTAAGSEAPVRVARVSEQLAIMVRDGASKAQMELHPPDLGRVTLEVEVRGEQVAVKMVVESQEAHQRLRSDAEALAESLEEQGLSLTGLDVSVDRQGAGEDDDEEATGLTSIEAALSEMRGDGEEALEPRTRRTHAGALDLQA